MEKVILLKGINLKGQSINKAILYKLDKTETEAILVGFGISGISPITEKSPRPRKLAHLFITPNVRVP